jgi:hypothetical protein
MRTGENSWLQPRLGQESGYFIPLVKSTARTDPTQCAHCPALERGSSHSSPLFSTIGVRRENRRQLLFEAEIPAPGDPQAATKWSDSLAQRTARLRSALVYPVTGALRSERPPLAFIDDLFLCFQAPTR